MPGQPQPGPYPQPAAFAARRRRRGLLITSIVLGVVLLLCGGGGTTAFFLLKSAGGSGGPTPAAAVDGFLTAVFREHDVDKANKFVCSASRDKAALGKKIDELRSYEQKYKRPQYSWATPTVDSRRGATAILTVPVKITTADDRIAEKKLRFVAIDDSGWWVCEVGDAK
jgi:flagellar basal body-associated protein FliL